jgi:AraC-like DNA-binding protein
MQPVVAGCCAGSAGGRGGLRAARLAAIVQTIDARLKDHDLTAAVVGAGLGLSERYVHHLLAGAGLKFTHVLRDKRLDHARRLLEDEAHATRRIAEIAYAAGFTDLSYFNRAFRRRFGQTPSAVRHRS